MGSEVYAHHLQWLLATRARLRQQKTQLNLAIQANPPGDAVGWAWINDAEQGITEEIVRFNQWYQQHPELCGDDQVGPDEPPGGSSMFHRLRAAVRSLLRGSPPATDEDEFSPRFYGACHRMEVNSDSDDSEWSCESWSDYTGATGIRKNGQKRRRRAGDRSEIRAALYRAQKRLRRPCEHCNRPYGVPDGVCGLRRTLRKRIAVLRARLCAPKELLAVDEVDTPAALQEQEQWDRLTGQAGASYQVWSDTLRYDGTVGHADPMDVAE